MLAEKQVCLPNLFGFVFSERDTIYAEFLIRTPVITQYTGQFMCETLDLNYYLTLCTHLS
jgi:hypothetical protein